MDTQVREHVWHVRLRPPGGRHVVLWIWGGWELKESGGVSLVCRKQVLPKTGLACAEAQ